MEPQKFGRYEIRAEIGRGGMATVYHAFDPRFEREVAIKVLPREMLFNPQLRTRFEREAKTIAMLENPAIVPVHDFGEEDGQPYFVMRYMTGGSLADRMKKGPISIQQAARILAHIATALDDAHAKGIVHRDLKPSNILFDQFNQPYISDFGIAKLTELHTDVTGSAIIGTPAYMSPEQAHGEAIDGRSDIYALGVILFEMLTGQQPYHGDTPMSVVIKQITDPVPHILEIKPDLPPDVDILIGKAMAKDRRERYLDVKSLSEALDKVARGERLVPETPALTMVPAAPTVAPSVLGVAYPVPPVPPPIATEAPPLPPAASSSAAARPASPPAAGTMMAQRPQIPPVAEQAQGQGAPSRKIGMWIGLGAGILVLCILAAFGIVMLRNRLPSRAARLATQTSPLVQEIPTLAAPTVTLAVVDLPLPSATPLPTDLPPTQPASFQAVFKINANIRSGPGTLYPILTVHTTGTQIEILGRNHAGDWLAFVLPGGKQGWAAVNALQVDFDVNTLSELYAPPPPTQPPEPTAAPSSGGGAKPTLAPP